MEGIRFNFVFQAEDGIRRLVRSRGLGDVYKRQMLADTNLGLSYEEILNRIRAWRDG